MPSKNHNVPMPHLDPEFVPEHPANNLPDFSMIEGEYHGEARPRTDSERSRAEKEWIKEQMTSWEPPHVIRSWESYDYRKERRETIMSLRLPPRIIHEYEDLNRTSAFDSSISKQIAADLYNPMNDPEQLDFRRFANINLRLGYHRFHASTGDPNVPSEELDPNIPESEICWLMEYTEGECNIIRRKIAHKIGEFPAAIDENSPLYNQELAWRYDRRLYVRCRRKNKKCVRPSHIVLFGSNFQDVP